MSYIRLDSGSASRSSKVFLIRCGIPGSTLGLVLVTIGVSSVLAYATARRTHEIGIRMALGAERADVLRLVVRRALRLVISGVAIGLAVSLGAATVIATQLWSVSPYDAETLITVPILLLLVGLAACWIPAQRAARSIR